MNSWSLVYEGFDAREEALREALCALGNGYFVTRGAAAENDADDVHYPGTYLAGGYNRLRTVINGHEVENEDLVNLPNWLSLTFRIEGGEWFNPQNVELMSYRQELDMRNGVLLRDIRFRDAQGRVSTLRHRRFCHMRKSHLAALETTLIAENWSGTVEIRTALDGRVVNGGVKRYQGLNNKHLVPVETSCASESMYLKVQTSQSEIHIAQAARTLVYRDGSQVSCQRRTVEEPGYVAQEFSLDLQRGNELRLEKVLALHTSRDMAIPECMLEARKALLRAGSFSELLRGHSLTWKRLWNRFDIEVEPVNPNGENRALLILHLHLFHILQTVSKQTIHLDAGMPARGWHGEAYRGHVFWDELFVFPLLNLHAPQITRALLLHRYWRLDEARANARGAGYSGAMFPWQSGSDGREESQKIHLNPKSGRWIPDNSYRQRHVNLAIAYNIWQYYEITGDTEFMSMYGAELLLEIARFWASLAKYNQHLERYEIFGVMGPDEYHDNYPDAEEGGLNNNSYTNVMAVWVLNRGLEILNTLPTDRCEELRELLGLTNEETENWSDITRRMRVVFHADGIISQFEGYEQLKEFDWEGYRAKYGKIARLDRILEAEGDHAKCYKASKQADVLMLFFLFSAEELTQLFVRLGYPFTRDTIPRNLEYYLKRTSHGSTLSAVVHSWVLARSDRPRSWQLFTNALESDISDVQGGTTAEGIHLGAMGGTVDLVQRGHTGIVTRGGVLWFNPRLPEEWAKMCMRLRYREHSLEVNISGTRLKVCSIAGPDRPIRIGHLKQVRELHAGETLEFDAVQPKRHR